MLPQMTTTERDSDNIEKMALKDTKKIEMANNVFFFTIMKIWIHQTLTFQSYAGHVDISRVRAQIVEVYWKVWSVKLVILFNVVPRGVLANSNLTTKYQTHFYSKCIMSKGMKNVASSNKKAKV